MDPLILKSIIESTESPYCTFCEKKFSTKGTLKRHIEEKHISKRFQCDICFKTFHRENYISFHKKMKHNIYWFEFGKKKVFKTIHVIYFIKCNCDSDLFCKSKSEYFNWYRNYSANLWFIKYFDLHFIYSFFQVSLFFALFKSLSVCMYEIRRINQLIWHLSITAVKCVWFFCNLKIKMVFGVFFFPKNYSCFFFVFFFFFI